MGVRQLIQRAWSALTRARRPADTAQQSWSTWVSLYGEPNAERVLTSYTEYAANAFAANAAVFGCQLARLAVFTEARLKWRDLETRKLSRTPALAPLERPWPSGVTGDLLARMIIDTDLAGNAFVRRVTPVLLERLRPDWVTIVSELSEPDDYGRQHRQVIGYVYDPIGDPERNIEYYTVDEVAHWAPTPDPLANWRGMSWLTPVLREINADIAMTRHRDAFFRHAATPNIIVRYAGQLRGDRLSKVRDAINARHGGPDKAGGTLVLDEGADVTIVGANMRDADFSAIQAAGENRIAVAAGVPAIVAGLKEGMDASSWSMYSQAVRRFVDVTMRPLWRSACASLESLTGAPDGAELWYDTADVAALQPGEAEAAQAFQVQAATASTLITAGYEPDSVVAAVQSGDLALLVHSGRYSVQLLPAGADGQGRRGDGPVRTDVGAG